MENEYGNDESTEEQTKKSEKEPEYKTDPKTGDLIYEDPVSKIVYVLDKKTNSWKQKLDNDYDFDGKTYFHTNENGIRHKWDLEENKWVQVENNTKDNNPTKELSSDNESEEDDNTTDEQRKARQYRKRKAAPGWNLQNHVFTDPENPEVKLYKDPNDGMTYEYDNEKKAWFPRINEDFMAQYQMNYGFTKDGQAEPTRPSEETESTKNVESEHSDPKKAKDKDIKKPQWFEHDSEKSTKVYVSLLPNGAPDDDWNEDEFVKFMSKCGVVDIDVRTNKPKAKLYKDEEGNFKGDGLCTYLKVESVQLALTILDGSCIKPGQAIKVEKAKFELKGSYNPKLKPKKLSKKEQERAKKRHEKMLAWEPDKLRGERTKRDKVIVIENVFDPKDFDQDASLILECSSRLREQCNKFGNVKKVVVYDKHIQGICQVFFSTPEEADMAISMLNGRMFSSNKIPMKSYTWDGKTKYKINETQEEEKERLANWDKFLADVETSEETSEKNEITEEKLITEEEVVKD